jgi:hypothetical protein
VVESNKQSGKKVEKPGMKSGDAALEKQRHPD